MRPSGIRVERVFVLLVDDRPILAFMSVNQMEAQQLAKERWLHDDLAELYSSGVRLWSDASRATVRAGTEAESATYRRMTADRHDVSGELLLAYLVPIDAAAG